MEYTDEAIMEVVAADVKLREQFPKNLSRFYIVEDVWTMVENPLRVRWVDKDKNVCGALLVGEPIKADKLVLLSCMEEYGRVFNIVAFNELYISVLEEETPVENPNN